MVLFAALQILLVQREKPARKILELGDQRRGFLRVVERGSSEVDQNETSIFLHEVFEFQIAMHDSLIVEVSENLYDLEKVIPDSFGRDGFLLEDFGEVLSFYVL